MASPPADPRPQRVVERQCGHCGTAFEPKRPHQVFCSSSCRWRAFSERRASAHAAGDASGDREGQTADPSERRADLPEPDVRHR